MTPAEPTEAQRQRADEFPSCPFCGEPAEYDSQRWERTAQPFGYTGHAVYCSGLDCACQVGIHDTKDEVVAAWNRRALSSEAAGMREEAAKWHDARAADCDETGGGRSAAGDLHRYSAAAIRSLPAAPEKKEPE